MKGDTQVIAMVSFFFAGAILKSVGDEDGTRWFALMLPAAATLVAAYLGAKLAFAYNQRDRDNSLLVARSDALNRALFELSRFHNKFLAIRRQTIDSERNHPVRHITIRPVTGVNWSPPEFNWDELAFLFHSSDPDFLGRLSLVQQEAAATLDIVRERSRYHFDVVQPALEAAIPDGEDGLTPAQVHAALGTRVTFTLISYTNELVEGVDNVLRSTIQESEKLHALAKEQLPGRQFIYFTSPVKDELMAPGA